MENLQQPIAQENGFDIGQYFSESEFWNDSLTVSLLVSLIVFSLVLIYLGNLFHNITKGLYPGAYIEKKKQEKKVEAPSVVLKALTDAVPIEEEESIMMDHEYDGIRELDNNLPPWWLYGFFFCILFGIVYFTHYHVMELGPSSVDEYNEEMMEAQKEIAEYRSTLKDFVSVDNVTYLEDAGSLAQGKEIFISKCQSCHKADGGGDIGPNLTDEYWLNGGDIKSIFTIVSKGKGGMPAWNVEMNNKDIQKVVSYIHVLQGTNPEVAKEAEGEKYTEE